MKLQTYGVLVMGCWSVFFLRILPGFSSFSFWAVVSLTVGMGAVHCTVNLCGDHESEEKIKGSSWKQYPWGVGIGWTLLIFILAAILPQYWSELFPLLVIGALYCASRLWTTRQSEDKLEDVSSGPDVNREAQEH
jgi:hypothetical protein